MSLFDDYRAEAQFASDYPFGVPCPVWRSKQGNIRVEDMTDEHIENCMRLVGEDDAWYAYFAEEIKRRKARRKGCEYIERRAAIEFVKNNAATLDGLTTLGCVERALYNAPAADVAEVRHGVWKKVCLTGCEPFYKCSLCDKVHYQDYDYCNNCGAKMNWK